jgi:hypothetical protein
VSRETTDSVENRRQRVDTPSSDVLQPYRLDQPNRLLGHGFNLPTKDTLDIPNIWKVNGTDSNTHDFKPDKSPTAKAGHEHVVTNSDTLWRIAKESLTANGDSASNTQISKRIQSIIKANAEEHPRLARNPHSIPPGMKLHIPDTDGPQQPGRASQRRERSEMPQKHEIPERQERRERAARPEQGDREKPAERQPASRDRQRPERDKVPNEASDKSSDRSRDKAASEGDGGMLARAMKQFGHDLADAAKRIAHSLGTIGDCAKGPRLTFKELGFHLPPAIATEQGRMLKESGLFHEVPRDEVRPGDYGVRDWNRHVTKRHGGVNKGDSFIVTAVSADGALRGANDHTFNVPEDGGRYRNLRFMRPTPEFFRRYGGNI